MKDWIRERANLGAFHSLLGGVIPCNSCSSFRHISCQEAREARGAPCARANSANLIGEYLEHRKTSSDFCCKQLNPRTSSNMFDDVQGCIMEWSTRSNICS